MDVAYSKLLDYLKQKNFREVLLIAFEDSDIIKLLQKNFNFNLKVLSKSDFVGSGLSSIAKKTRERKYDLVIISNVNSQVNRTKTSIKILALLSKSNDYFILFNEEEYSVTSKFKLLFELFPRLLIGLIYSIFLLIKTYFFFYFYYPITIKRIGHTYKRIHQWSKTTWFRYNLFIGFSIN
jgi:hypothetical protein